MEANNRSRPISNGMDAPTEVAKLFATYKEDIDIGLLEVFNAFADIEMYQQLAYFMGFRDERLLPREEYGGKRFRSSLMLMVADFYGDRDSARDAALSLELFHNFTLIHDDIVDGDTHRRGRPTVWKLFGTPHAINSGDVQFIVATEVLARDPEKTSSTLQQFMLAKYRTVIEGQYYDFTYTDLPLGHPEVTEEACLRMNAHKTTALVVAATEGAGIATGQSEEERMHLRTYGEYLGSAYQICDDVVSIWGTSEQTGKRAYGDLLEQKKTLPILRALTLLSEAKRATVIEIFNKNTAVTEAEAETIAKLLDETTVYENTRALVDEYAAKAKAAARSLSLPKEKQEILVSIVDALLPDIKKV